jgi:hypothetical protein
MATIRAAIRTLRAEGEVIERRSAGGALRDASWAAFVARFSLLLSARLSNARIVARHRRGHVAPPNPKDQMSSQPHSIFVVVGPFTWWPEQEKVRPGMLLAIDEWEAKDLLESGWLERLRLPRAAGGASARAVAPVPRARRSPVAVPPRSRRVGDVA